MVDPRRSLRARIALVMMLLGLLVAAGIGVAVYSVTSDQLTSSARSNAQSAVTVAAGVYDRAKQVVAGAVRDDRSAPAPLRRAVSHGQLGTYVSGQSVWAGTPLPGGHGIYVREASDIPHTLSVLGTTLIIVGVIALLVAAAIGTLLSGGLSRSLRSAAAVADRVAGGELNARVQASGRDEVARLGRAIDEMSASLSERIERERRFSADVAHELRTPLTALVSAAALLDDSRPSQIVRERVGAMRSLVEDLLEVLRLEQGREQVQREDVNLTAIARRVIGERDAGDRVQLDGEALVVQTDPRRLARVLANLLDNALRHGAGPVHVQVCEGALITVADHGPGYPQSLLEQGPAPFHTGSTERGSGTGLGLVIAASQISALGGELRLSNAPEGGAVAVVSLPSSAVDLPVSAAD